MLPVCGDLLANYRHPEGFFRGWKTNKMCSPEKQTISPVNCHNCLKRAHSVVACAESVIELDLFDIFELRLLKIKSNLKLEVNNEYFL